MRLKGLLAVLPVAGLLLLSTAAPIEAQSYSSEEQALLERMDGCWADFLESWQSWVDGCTHSDSHYWGPNTVGPLDRDMYRTFYDATYGKDFTWVYNDLRPNMVTIRGDVAMVYFNSSHAFRDADAVLALQEDIRLEVWVRDGGQWMLLRGMWAPMQAAPIG